MPRRAMVIAWTYVLGPTKEILVDAWTLAWRHRRAAIVSCICIALACAAILPFDTAVVEAMGSEERTDSITQAAKWISWLGKFEIGTLAVTGSLMTAGLLLRRRLLRYAAIASLLASVCAGLTANMLRPTIGRTRPSADVEQGLYGPSLETKFHSFPSAHAATASGTGVALVAACGPVAIPVLAAVLLVAWSRLHLRRHHLTDLLVGLAIGSLYGYFFGRAARRTAARLDEAERKESA